MGELVAYKLEKNGVGFLRQQNPSFEEVNMKENNRKEIYKIWENPVLNQPKCDPRLKHGFNEGEDVIGCNSVKQLELWFPT